MQLKAHVIVVTHNSENVIDTCIAGVKKQGNIVATITIVDSGSGDTSYLDKLEQDGVNVIRSKNVGFSCANNLGFASLKPNTSDIILFLNPDAFLQPGTVARFNEIFLADPTLGCVTGKLLGYDPLKETATGKLDSTGVFRKWYGRWFDRGQGEVDVGRYDTQQYVPAICGALMCCSMEALSSFGKNVFDTSFFMYKEDVELSLKLRRNGWKLLYVPDIVAYHCRGWNADRGNVSYGSKLISAENEVKLYLRHPSMYIIWAVFKYLIVRLFRV
ncbi:glycosyltransferase [Desulforhopalus sp. 52FAK]